jgi:hypothetical protein
MENYVYKLFAEAGMMDGATWLEHVFDRYANKQDLLTTGTCVAYL